MVKLRNNTSKSREDLFRDMTPDHLRSVMSICDGPSFLWKKLGLGGKPTSVWKSIILDKGLDKELEALYARGKARSREGSRRPNSTVPWIKENLDKIFCRDSICDNAQLRRLIRNYNKIFSWLEEKCQSCGLEPFWNGKPLTLQIEHKNGVYGDHRFENLCFLCPNCHSQTDTYAARNIGKKGDRFYELSRVL